MNMMYEKKLVKERNGWKMWKDWVSDNFIPSINIKYVSVKEDE